MSDEEKNVNESLDEENKEEVNEVIEEDLPGQTKATSVEDTVFEEAPKKKKKARKQRTPEEKKKKRIRDIIISCSVIFAVALFFAICAIAGYGGSKTNNKMIDKIETVGCELTPEIDEETGYYTFTTDRDFKVLQLTDVHIGAGAFSIKKDSWAINAVAKLVQTVKPDLVIVTGDVGYPVPFQAGTFNNLRAAETFAHLMEQLGVYYAFVYGNHDTEAYSLYDRKEISEKVYLQEQYKHCLFQMGPNDVDGYGNYIINVKNSLGLITESFVMLDSHSYTNGDILGIAWEYDNIHPNQVEWYENEIKSLNTKNIAKYNSLSESEKDALATIIGEDKTATALRFSNPDSMTVKSSLYFHIPLEEYKDAWYEYADAGEDDSGLNNLTFNFGVAGENKKIVYCGVGTDELFEKAQALKSTTNVFCGHDHLNNFSITYYGKEGNKTTDHGITLTYGMSIDYLAYTGIYKKVEQRGGTIITVATNGAITITQKKLIDC